MLLDSRRVGTGAIGDAAQEVCGCGPGTGVDRVEYRYQEVKILRLLEHDIVTLHG